MSEHYGPFNTDVLRQEVFTGLLGIGGPGSVPVGEHHVLE